MTEALSALLPWKGLAVGLWFAALFLAERARPAVTDRLGWARVARNALLFLPVVALSWFIVLPLSSFASEQALTWRPSWWDGWLGLALDLLLLDFLIYWWHRFNHELPFLWRFHEVHHRDTFLDASTALRFHFGEVLLSALARALVILLLGFPLSAILVFEALVLMAAIFHHSNLKLPPRFERFLSQLIVTPSIHWVHHHALRADTDSNYSTILSLWDRLFASKSPTARTNDMAIGCQGKPELPLGQLLLSPFRKEA